jgi:hypothetical protein
MSEVVDLLYFSDFVDGRRQFLVQDITGISFGRRAIASCVLLRTAGLFIDSQILIGDGALLDLAMMEARRSFQRASRRCWSWTVTAGFGISRSLTVLSAKFLG